MIAQNSRYLTNGKEGPKQKDYDTRSYQVAWVKLGLTWWNPLCWEQAKIGW